MNVTPKAKVLGLRSRMAKSRRQLEKENTDSSYSICAESSGKTAVSEGCKDNQCDSINNNNSCMVTPVKSNLNTEEESPDIPSSSRFIQSLLPKAFGSPEIDVSWDWSSSQITDAGNSSTDSFVPKMKHSKTRTLKRRLPRALPPAVIMRPRLPLDKCFSEEELQKRLEFYRNLYNEIKDNIVETESSVKKSILDSESKTGTFMERQDEKYEALFDDSNNEIMLECSQAIEEVFQVKDRVISNLSDPSEEQSSCVVHLHDADTESVENVFCEVLDNRTNITVSDKKINNELRTSVVSKDDMLYGINKSDNTCSQGRTRTLQCKTEFKHQRQSFKATEDDDFRVHKHQMDVTMLFNDDNDDELSSLAVDILPSVPGKSLKKVSDLETKRCSRVEIEEKRRQALRKLMKKKGISRN